MQTKTRYLLAGALLGAASLAQAGTSANVYVVSDYLFRGVTQTNDGAAVQGGIDYEHDSGFYAGTWMSTLGNGAGVEDDIYLGFAGEAGSISYDIGAIRYIYPSLTDFDATEIYAGIDVGPVGVKYWYEVNGDWGYLEGNASFDLKEDLSLSLHIGSTDFNGGGDYIDYNVALGKTWKDLDWSLMISNTDISGDDWTIVASAGYSFDL